MAKQKQKRKSNSSTPTSKRVKSIQNPKRHPHQQPRKEHPMQASQRPPDVPFKKDEDVLLVGEGDFSFARCLCEHYSDSFGTLTATSLDPEEDVYAKYPQSREHIRVLKAVDDGSESLSNGRTNGMNSTDDADDKDDANDTDDQPFEGFSPPPSPPSTSHTHPRIRIMHGIDATALHSHRPLRRRAGYDLIAFNFPHTGGLTTDVNRQVRANQALLVAFFARAKSLLAPRGLSTPIDPAFADVPIEERPEAEDRISYDSNGGRICITLFEGEPYELWNVRDLARHAGYVVERSWRFDWAAFPGYAHARTLGNMRSRTERDGRVEVAANGDGETSVERAQPKGAWKGEERAARSYLLHVRPPEGDEKTQKKKRKRRSGEEEASDSD